MWKMIALLWLIPIVLGAGAATRVALRGRVLTRKELRFFLGRADRGNLSWWFWLALAALAIAFFAIGVLATLLAILLIRSRVSHSGARRKTRRQKREQIAYSADF